MYNLVAVMPIAKKVFRLNTIESDIDIEQAVSIAKGEASFVLEEIKRMKMNHPRSFISMPKYLKFIIMYMSDNIRFEKNRKVGEFRIWLDSGDIEITNEW